MAPKICHRSIQRTAGTWEWEEESLGELFIHPRSTRKTADLITAQVSRCYSETRGHFQPAVVVASAADTGAQENLISICKGWLERSTILECSQSAGVGVP